ncbi:hypothetical protein FACS1894200_07600 [Spirochaetia bacterium]|nr:hypothetical protein FACS1894200_07600 [Spirochaetia bacterium]
MKTIGYVLLTMVFVVPIYAQDATAFNKISGSYEISQMQISPGPKPAMIGGEKTTIVVTVDRPDKLSASSSIDEIWSYVTLPVPSVSRPKNICFVIDISGSMGSTISGSSEKTRLDWVKEVFSILIDEIKDNDFISVVVFDGGVETIFEPLRIKNRQDRQICIDRINQLQPQGGTLIAPGLRRGYELIQKNYEREYINRVVLLTDGASNTDADRGYAKQSVQEYMNKGIATVSTIALSGEADKSFMDEISREGGGVSILVDVYQKPVDFKGKFRVLLTSNRKEIQEELDKLYETASWNIDVTVTLAEGVIFVGAEPCKNREAQISGAKVSYKGIPLSYENLESQSMRAEISVRLNDTALKNNRVLSLNIVSRGNNNKFKTYDLIKSISIENSTVDDTIFVVKKGSL